MTEDIKKAVESCEEIMKEYNVPNTILTGNTITIIKEEKREIDLTQIIRSKN